MIEILPAIDLMGGQAVRLRKGDFETREKVADDPVATAIGFARTGARRIHVVDLDGARTGEPVNHPVIRAIVEAVDVPVQVGGGLRTVERVAAILALGADRAVVGTSAARDPEAIAAILGAHGPRIVVGADVHGDRIAVHGWKESTEETSADFARRMTALGASRFLFTDIARDGMLEGANVKATAAFARVAGVPVLASGGVAGIDDIRRLRRVVRDGVEGVVMGKALYAGRIDLAEAIALAETGEEAGDA